MLVGLFWCWVVCFGSGLYVWFGVLWCALVFVGFFRCWVVCFGIGCSVVVLVGLFWRWLVFFGGVLFMTTRSAATGWPFSPARSHSGQFHAYKRGALHRLYRIQGVIKDELHAVQGFLFIRYAPQMVWLVEKLHNIAVDSIS